MALMYPGTFRQPPNYASQWYSRQDDHHGVRAMLDWVNAKRAGGTWEIAEFDRHGDLVAGPRQPRYGRQPGDDTHLQRDDRPRSHRHSCSSCTWRTAATSQPRTCGWRSTSHPTRSSGAGTTHRLLHVEHVQHLVERLAERPGAQTRCRRAGTSSAGSSPPVSAERSSSNNIALLLKDRNSGFAPIRITVT